MLTAVLVGAVELVVVSLEISQVLKGHLVSEDTADTTETLDELTAFLRFVGHKFERGTKVLVLLGEPLEQGLRLGSGFHLQSSRLVHELLPVLIGGGRVHDDLLAGGISERVSGNVQVLPDNQGLHCTHIESFEGVDNAETVLSGVEGDLVEVLLNQSFLLYELDVGQRVGSELDSLKECFSTTTSQYGLSTDLVETVLSSITDIDDLDNLGEKSGVEQVTSTQVGLELCTTGQHQTSNIDLVVGDEMLDCQLGDFSHIVSPRFLSQTGETQSRLTTSTVLLGKVDGELVNDFSGITGECSKQRTVSVASQVSVVVTTKERGVLT